MAKDKKKKDKKKKKSDDKAIDTFSQLYTTQGEATSKAKVHLGVSLGQSIDRSSDKLFLGS